MSSDAATPDRTRKPTTARFSTDDVAEHRRAAYWSDALTRVFGGVEVPVADEGCRGTVQASLLGLVQVVTVEGAPMAMNRPAQPAGSRHDGCLMVMSLFDGTAVVTRGGQVTPVRPGETVFYDSARPMRIDFTSAFRVACLIFPRTLIGLPDTHLRRVLGAPISRCAPSASLLWPLLAGLGETVPKLPPGSGEVLLRHVVGLLSVVAEEPLPEDHPSSPASQDLLSRIKSYIDQRLGDPALSLASIARAHHISVRYLHKLFESEDTTASRWIQRRRLQRCRHELARQESATVTISSVARQSGFSSAAHFSRVFRRAYGMSPAEWREKVLRESEPVQTRKTATGTAERGTRMPLLSALSLRRPPGPAAA